MVIVVAMVVAVVVVLVCFLHSGHLWPHDWFPRLAADAVVVAAGPDS